MFLKNSKKSNVDGVTERLPTEHHHDNLAVVTLVSESPEQRGGVI